MRKGLACVLGLATGDERSQSSQVLHICRRLLESRDVGEQPVPLPDHPRVTLRPAVGRTARSGVATVSGFAFCLLPFAFPQSR